MQILASLRKDWALMKVLMGNHDGAIRSMFPYPLPGPHILLSADLTSTTDLLPLNLYKTVWLGVTKGQGLPVWMTRFGVLVP